MEIAIVGGGITGLTTAYYLSNQKSKVKVFEKEDKIGGLAASFKERNWDWPLEEYFHHYFISDTEIKNLVKDLNLDDNLFYQKVQTSVYYQGSICPFDQPGDLLKFPHLKLVDKLRMGGAIFCLTALPYLPIYNKFSAVNLFPKLIGKKSWEMVWQPLMDNKFHQYTDQVSFSWLWSRLKKRSPQLGYFKGGTDSLITKLSSEIEKKGQILKSTKIEKIKKENGQWHLYSQNKEYTAQKVILAMPMPAALKLIHTWKEINPKMASQWRSLKSMSAMALVLRSKVKFLPGDTYWLNILDDSFPFLVLVEHTNFISPKRYGGENIIYIGGYYDKNGVGMSDKKEKVFQHFAPFLRRLNPSFENYLIDYQLFKYQNAQPVIPVNYSKIKPNISLIPDELYWATANHIFPWDRGVNYSIQLGKKTADLVLGE